MANTVNRLLWGILFSVTLASFSPAVGQAGSFDEGQKAELNVLIRQYLLEHPEVLPEAFEELRRRELKAALKLYEQALYDDGGSFVGGNPDGKVTIIEFFDYQCGYCKKVSPTLARLQADNKDLRIIYKELPILGPGSEVAARATLASISQNRYEEFHHALMSSSGNMTEAKVMKIATDIGLDVERLKQDMVSRDIGIIIQNNRGLAGALGITGTPAFIIGDEIIPGAESYAVLSAKLQVLREQ